MAGYRDDQGEMDGIGERPLRDFLPPPEQLVQCRGNGQGQAGPESGERLLLTGSGRALQAHDQGAGRRVRQAGIGRARMRSRWHASTFLTAADRSYNPH